MIRALLPLALLGCAQPKPDDTAASEDLVATLAAAGPWRVGHHSQTVTYTEPFDGGARSVRLSAWYPTTASAGPDAEYLIPKVDPGAFEGVAPEPGPWPVAIFSHGHRGFSENSSFLMVHLASHGWLVLAPDHTGNTILDGEDRETPIYGQRPLDLSAVLDAVTALPAGETLSGLAGSPVVGLGHSFGGYTAYAADGATYAMDSLEPACAEGSGPSSFCATMNEDYAALFRAGFHDDRLIGFVAMAGGDFDLFEAPGLASVSVPVLIMAGSLDGTPPTPSDDYWEALRGGDNRCVDLLGGGHQSFTDFAGILEDPEGLIPPEEGWRIVDVYALAWLQWLSGDEAMRSVLDGALTVSDQAVLSQ